MFWKDTKTRWCQSYTGTFCYEKTLIWYIFAEFETFNESVCNNGCQCCDESVVLTDKQLLEKTPYGYCHIHGCADYAGRSPVEYLIYSEGWRRIDL